MARYGRFSKIFQEMNTHVAKVLCAMPMTKILTTPPLFGTGPGGTTGSLNSCR
jgi:hypothetical protein